jgi:rhodanese-related sulfurtransferase
MNMTPFPLAMTETFGQAGAYLVYLLIGFAFGYALEIAGFARSTKLAAQFYFKDQTVLKVMFTAIVVAMVLIFGASALGLLDINLIWVNPTYLWPGIVGGLIMGAGFIIGGFCPGTSLVALATAKIDGLFFALGALFGIFIFGETVDSFSAFWNSSYLGRFTLMDWLGLNTGTVVVLVIAMALFMFWGAEQLEKRFGGKDPSRAPRARYGGAAVLAFAAVGVAFLGQPSNLDRWLKLQPEKAPLLENRSVQVHPGEVLDLMKNNQLRLELIDIRSETDFNLFHVKNAIHIPFAELPERVPDLHLEPANTVFLLVGNDEQTASEAWKMLVAESVPNVYILEGGINNWLSIFAAEAEGILPAASQGMDTLKYQFDAALGDRHPAADPDPHDFVLIYESKVILEMKKGPSSGGCG